MYFNIKALLEETEEWNKENTSIYKRVYNAFKDLILKKAIPNNTQLPPTRVLAKDLNVSRSTIIKAFDLLCFERFIISKKGSGYYVNYIVSEIKVEEKESNNIKYPKISKRAKQFLKHQYVNTDNFSKTNIAFRPGLPPLDIFPIHKWKQVSNNYWRETTPTNLSYAPTAGLESLQISIMNYLRIYRNLHCNFNQIIITSGSLHSLYLIGNALLDKGDEIIMENPTFPRAYNLFKSLKATIIPCNVCSEGICIDSIENKKAKLIYTTPSNQYPLGIKMSKNRRKELLEYASKNNSLIIEDDYDHEFSNWENPIPSVFSLDNEKRVIYIGTFNKLLHPSLRIGYMIVPKYLINPIKSIYEQSSRFVSVHLQEQLQEFIKKDHLNKHIRNVISVSEKRKTDFINQTKNIFNISKHFDGLHLIGKFKSDFDDKKIYQELLKREVVAYPLSNYYITKEKQSGLVMGFSSVNEKVMKEKTQQMNFLFNSLKS
ncbi:MocR-like pyridoxine biosynthesis transcription factor PdxR [Tenacibaculum crassostreae]|uniref:MocR-like pyridoxine biosynthesis transcription factor PdxR n=1 Tax=Tenacibaculum crassostreae TaxID=502683 RepID=UPI003894B9DD